MLHGKSCNSPLKACWVFFRTSKNLSCLESVCLCNFNRRAVSCCSSPPSPLLSLSRGSDGGLWSSWFGRTVTEHALPTWRPLSAMAVAFLLLIRANTLARCASNYSARFCSASSLTRNASCSCSRVLFTRATSLDGAFFLTASWSFLSSCIDLATIS